MNASKPCGKPPPERESRPRRGGDLKDTGTGSTVESNGIRHNPQDLPSSSDFKLASWCRFRWRIIGSAKVTHDDLIVDDVLIFTIETADFALVKRDQGPLSFRLVEAPADGGRRFSFG